MKDIIGRINRTLNRINNMLHQGDRNPLSLFAYIIRLQYSRKFCFAEIHDNELDLYGKDYEKSFLNCEEQQHYLALLNPRKYYSLARNKYLAHLMFEAQGIASHAKLLCYYNPEQRTVSGDKRCSWNLTTTIACLKDTGADSFVVKTTESSHGDNVWVFKKLRYIGEDVELVRFDDNKQKLSEILKNEPLIFESVIVQTQQFSAFNPDSVNTIRFMTTLFPEGEARVIASFLKIGRSGKCIDNAGNGGNVDAAVDVKTGRIYNVIEFKNIREHESIERHPDTKSQLDGVIIENWDIIKEKVITFQKAMPFIKAAGWDIALTDNGPIIVEVNDMWDRIGQLFIGHGWKHEIEECYLAWKKYYKK